MRVVLSFGPQRALKDSQRREVTRLAQVQTHNVCWLLFPHALIPPKRGATSSAQAAITSACKKTASTVSLNSQKFSCVNQCSPSANRSSSRKAAGMRGHSAAVIRTRARRSRGMSGHKPTLPCLCCLNHRTGPPRCHPAGRNYGRRTQRGPLGMELRSRDRVRPPCCPRQLRSG